MQYSSTLRNHHWASSSKASNVNLSYFHVDDVEHFYSAHIHTIECSWRLADVLACSQKVSHPEMRLVSAAIGASFHFPF
jgi:hypothetical protein